MPLTETLSGWDWSLVNAESKRKNKVFNCIITSITGNFESFCGVARLASTCRSQYLQEGDWVKTIQYYGTYDKNELEHIYPELVHKLEYIRHLPENWDTYGSSAPSGLVVYCAYILLNSLRKSAGLRGTELPEPEACPGPGGILQFDWDINEKALEFRVSMKNGRVTYRFLLCPTDDPDTWQEGEFTGPVSEHPAIQAFLSWI